MTMIALIAAVTANGCIGKNGGLPRYLPEDLKRFRVLTLGKTVLMGRKTWESLPEKFRPLPDRKNIVISRQTEYQVPLSVLLYPTIDAALTAHPREDMMIIGGGEIYHQTIDRADTLFITRIHERVDGDVFFPTIDPSQWREIEREDHPHYSFLTYKRI